MCISTWVYTKIFGKLVGKDEFGNSYYESKWFKRDFERNNRWVYYKGLAEGSKVPAEWFRWLHYQQDDVPNIKNRISKQWIKNHLPNLTGTKKAYNPATPKFGKGNGVTGDYQPWKP